jgi:rifampin ADP-ribosylating transferase
MGENKSDNKSVQSPFTLTFFHGTKADLKIGDFIEIGLGSNYGQKSQSKYIYLTATLDAAIWGAELGHTCLATGINYGTHKLLHWP